MLLRFNFLMADRYLPKSYNLKTAISDNIGRYLRINLSYANIHVFTQ